MERPRFPPLRIFGDIEGWVDLEFAIAGHRIEGDNEFYMICAGASHDDREIAFNVLFPCRWVHDPPKGAPRGLFDYRAGMALVNAVPVEKAFMETLASLWSLPAPTGGMANFTEVSAISLGGNPERVLHEPISLKIFFGSYENAPIPYAEAYLNLDLPNRSLQLKEKDPHYRGAIIEGLLKGTPEEP
jgi:hypothetical protein